MNIAHVFHRHKLLNDDIGFACVNHSVKFKNELASYLVWQERDRLIRTGMLTPFDKVKGFERKVHRVPKAESEDELRARQAAANLASSLAASAMFRPTSRLLDASELPSQEPPMREFRRLRTPLKTVRPESEECQRQAKKKSDKRPKRPQVDKKWRKRPDESDEDFVVDEEDGKLVAL